MYKLVLGSILIIVACHQENDRSGNEKKCCETYTNQVKSVKKYDVSDLKIASFIGLLSDSVTCQKNEGNNELFSFVALKWLRFLKGNKQLIVSDSFVLNKSKVRFLFKNGASDIKSLDVLKVNDSLFCFYFLFDRKCIFGNSIIHKNGFYIYNTISQKCLFFKCLTNSLPLNVEFSMEYVSSISIVDKDLRPTKTFYYYKRELQKVFLFDTMGYYLNIGVPTYEKVNVLNSLDDSSNVLQVFKFIDNNRILFDPNALSNLRSKKLRLNRTYNWEYFD
jgi:hypothetical protein